MTSLRTLSLILCALLAGCSDCGRAGREKEQLISAAARGETQAVTDFVADGGDPRLTVWRPSGGRLGSVSSLLHAAVGSGSWETLQPLLVDDAARADALQHALRLHRLEVAQRLVEGGAQIRSESAGNLVFKIIDYPHYLEVEEGSVLRAMQLLKRSGYAFTHDDLETALRAVYLRRTRLSESRPPPPPGTASLPEVVALIWETRPDLQGEAGALDLAIRAGMTELALELIAAGAAVNGAETEEDGPLFAAVLANSPPLVDALLKAGADPARTDRPGHGGDNAVQFARKLGDRAEIEALLCKAAPTACAPAP